jgi:hypothetical protein
MRTYVVALTIATTVTAATAELAASGAVAAVHAAGFGAGTVTDVLDVDAPLPITMLVAADESADLERCGAVGAAGKPLESELR